MRRRLALCLALAVRVEAQAPEVEVGAENLYYRTTETPLNRGNVLDLDPSEDLLRGSLNLKQSLGEARFVFRGYVERALGGTGNETRFAARQAYAQYANTTRYSATRDAFHSNAIRVARACLSKHTDTIGN